MWAQKSKRLEDIFYDLTINFSPEDWRKVRNDDYWLSDYLPPDQRLMHKIERVEYYNTHRVIKPYSPAKIQMFIKDLEKAGNESKSILNPSKNINYGKKKEESSQTSSIGS